VNNEVITERITNIAELENIINKCYAIAQIIQKENPDSKDSLMLVDLLKNASEFEFHIERRKTSYCE